MILPLLSLFTSLLITFLIVPSIIKVAGIRNLFDIPCERKNHQEAITNLGGIAIFGGILFSLSFWSSDKDIVYLKYVISSIVIIFFIGLRDDIISINAKKKLFGQILSAFVLVHWADIRITTFYGLFGIGDISIIPSYIFSVFTIIVITNAFNLIDGIDGLAAGIGTISSIVLGYWFASMGSLEYAILASSLAGALLGFLWYNRPPAKIFMGDTGSLLVGLILSILAIKFIEMNRVLQLDHPRKVFSVPVVTLAILVIPLFDTIRVFTIRILQGRSPLSADRNHIHHLLLSLGFSHLKATISLLTFNVLMILLSFKLQLLRGEILLAIILGICIATSSYVTFLSRKRRLMSNVKNFDKFSSQGLEK